MNEATLPELNILLFGETGAGKSTTINALANYLRFRSFDEALQCEKFEQLIPSKFILTHPDTFDLVEIQDFNDENEFHNDDGQSVTKSPRDYEFICEQQQRKIRIIDTPGMADTRGVEADRENIGSIIRFLESNLHKFDTLHAICFVIKTTTTKETANFRKSITELLFNLHKEACKNIIFCFTYCRNSMYGAGDGFVTLRAFMSQNKLNADNPIELKSGVNCFYIDNEAYRFLLAQKQKFPFTNEEIESYKQSWNKSAAQIDLMMKRVVNLPSHSTLNTIMMSECREWLVNLKQPFWRTRDTVMRSIDQCYQVWNEKLKTLHQLQISNKFKSEMNKFKSHKFEPYCKPNNFIHTEKNLQNDIQIEEAKIEKFKNALSSIEETIYQMYNFLLNGSFMPIQNIIAPYEALPRKVSNHSKLPTILTQPNEIFKLIEETRPLFDALLNNGLIDVDKKDLFNWAKNNKVNIKTFEDFSKENESRPILEGNRLIPNSENSLFEISPTNEQLNSEPTSFKSQGPTENNVVETQSDPFRDTDKVKALDSSGRDPNFKPNNLCKSDQAQENCQESKVSNTKPLQEADGKPENAARMILNKNDETERKVEEHFDVHSQPGSMLDLSKIFDENISTDTNLDDEGLNLKKNENQLSRLSVENSPEKVANIVKPEMIQPKLFQRKNCKKSLNIENIDNQRKILAKQLNNNHGEDDSTASGKIHEPNSDGKNHESTDNLYSHNRNEDIERTKAQSGVALELPKKTPSKIRRLGQRICRGICRRFQFIWKTCQCSDN